VPVLTTTAVEGSTRKSGTTEAGLEGKGESAPQTLSRQKVCVLRRDVLKVDVSR